ncbi:aldo/keto reductase [Candidatus Gracilibacteria bacterium]|nr:aldo/keto reductase [Candidatus Gracilibacteria bacterium]
MKKNKLGNTGIDVTKICLGTMTWGHQNTELDAHNQLDYAILEAGINFIDTAEVYAIPPSPDTSGLTEKYIGTWFAKNPGIRESIILASKFVGPGMDWIRNGRGLHAPDMRAAVEGSLERLQTDYIDLYQLHWPQRSVNKMGKMNYESSMHSSLDHEEDHIVSLLRAFEELQKEGKVKYLGLSNETPWGTMKFLELARKHNLPEIQTVQNPYSLLNRQYEVGGAEISLFEGVGLLAYSPLAGGVLTGKYNNGQMPKGSRYETWGSARQKQNLNDRALSFVESLQNIADKVGISVTQLSLAWVNQKEYVHGNIIGATTLEQLKEDIDSINIRLGDETLHEIDSIFSQNPNPATY